jgi:hypothetical protein
MLAGGSDIRAGATKDTEDREDTTMGLLSCTGCPLARRVNVRGEGSGLDKVKTTVLPPLSPP